VVADPSIPATHTTPPATRPTLFPVLLVNFIDALGISIVIPFLVFLVSDFGGNGFVYGLVSATYPACQFLAAPLLGRWSDQYGRRRLLLLCELGTFAGWTLFAIALLVPKRVLGHVDSRSLGAFTLTLPLCVIFVARALDGFTGGNISVANAYVADVSTPENQARNFGRMSISSNLGFVIGPAVAGLLGAVGLGKTLPVLLTLAASLVATVVIVTSIRESHLRPRDAGGGDSAPVTRSGTVAETLAVRHIPRVLAVYLLTYLAFNFYYASMPVHAVKALGWTVTGTGIYFGALSLLMVLVQGPVLAAAEKRFTGPTLILVGSALLAANFLLLLSPRLPAIGASVALFALGNGLMWPTVVATLARLAGERLQGSAQGLASSCASAASIVGLVAGGFTYEPLGAATFALSAGFIAAAGLLMLGCMKRSC
jgi:MFS family permease